MADAKMRDTNKVPAPAIRQGHSRLIAGVKEHYDHDGPKLIPAQWQHFNRYFGNIPGQLGTVAYGVQYNLASDGSYDYLAGVEVSSFAEVPRELSRLEVPAQKYAAFPHEGHVSQLSDTIGVLANNWQPAWGRMNSGVIAVIERYGEHFDPQTGRGDIEVWFPVEG